MIHFLAALFGAAFTVTVAIAAGRVLLRRLGLRFYREEEHFFAFLTGAACLSLMVFVLACVRQARPGVFLLLGAGIIIAALRAGKAPLPDGRGPEAPRAWRIAFKTLFAAFAIFYFATALAPETSPDGTAYHVGLIARYLRAGGFYRITTNMYAYLSQGCEMLFLYAYAFGRHSAAALTHFAFFLALPLAMAAYGRRFRFPAAGITAALLVFMSPIVGFDGATAYIDVALAAVLFGLFYLLQIWDRERTPALLVPIGLLAGFAYAVKYTGFLALPYAAAFVAWKTLRKRQNPVRPAAVVALCAVALIAPWMLKNWLWVSNPLAPFYNRWFENPYVHAGFEDQYRRYMAHYGDVKSWREVPLEVTVRGARLQGLLGPAFLLLPVALVALRRQAGRQLLLAALVFGLTYPANLGTRFLIPALPFASLALGVAIADWRWAAPVLLAFHAYTCWPTHIKRWADPYGMRIDRFPWKAALRWEREENYLKRVMPAIEVAQMVDQKTPPGAKVLAFGSPPESYSERDYLVCYTGALNQNLCDGLMAVQTPAWQPTRRWVFRFPEQAVRRIRVVQAARTSNSDEYWQINELRVYRGAAEIPREPHWRLRAHPNPWEVTLAFDNNPMTRWRSWKPLAPGMFVELDFNSTVAIDSLTIDSVPEQPSARMWIEAWLGDGRQAPLGDATQAGDILPPANMRRWAAAEIRWSGIEYLLINDSDWVAKDVRMFANEYGITEVGEKQGSRLYRID